MHFYGFNSPVKLWLIEIESVSFIPVKFITVRYVACKEELKFQNNNSRYSYKYCNKTTYQVNCILNYNFLHFHSTTGPNELCDVQVCSPERP